MRSIEDHILITEREEEEQIEELQLDDLGEEILWSIVAFLPRRLDYRAVCPNWSDVLDFRPYGRRDLGAPKPPSELCFEFDTVWSKYVYCINIDPDYPQYKVDFLDWIPARLRCHPNDVTPVSWTIAAESFDELWRLVRKILEGNPAPGDLTNGKAVLKICEDGQNTRLSIGKKVGDLILKLLDTRGPPKIQVPTVQRLGPVPVPLPGRVR